VGTVVHEDRVGLLAGQRGDGTAQVSGKRQELLRRDRFDRLLARSAGQGFQVET
jgi:hypothetical protein